MLRVELDGALPAGVVAKDVVLHLLALPPIRAGGGVGQVFEFAGPVVRAMATDERATLTNMTAELGGLTGIVEPDEETRALPARAARRWRASCEPWMRSDPGAAYAQVLTRRLQRAVADGRRARAIRARACRSTRCESPVRIDIAYGGSCTAGKREDFDQYHAVLAWGLAHGLQVAAARPAVPAVRHDRRARLLHRARLRPRVRRRRRAHPAALVRRLRQLRAGLLDRAPAR